MKTIISVFLLLAVSLLLTSSAHTYIYFVEAEDYDPDKSELEVGGVKWELKEGDFLADEASGEQYMECSGADKLALSSLIYPIPDDNATVTIWIRCRMHSTGHDSYFFYFSDDGGKEWTDQIKGSGGGGDPEWQWKTWNNTVTLKRGGENLLKVSERENASLDAICLRDDGGTPSDDEMGAWLSANPEDEEKIAVRALDKLSTTWGRIKN